MYHAEGPHDLSLVEIGVVLVEGPIQRIEVLSGAPLHFHVKLKDYASSVATCYRLEV